MYAESQRIQHDAQYLCADASSTILNQELSPKLKRIYVHIGLQKTGTTFIQAALEANRELLEDRNLLIPRTGFLSKGLASSNEAHSGHATLRSAFKATTIPSAGYHFRERLLRELIVSPAQLVLISSEIFFTPQKSVDPNRLKAVLGSIGDVFPVVYLRRQDYFADSFYREMLGWPETRLAGGTFQFVRRIMGEPWLDFRQRLNPWLRVFSPSEITVRSYDDISAGGSILDDLLSIVGVSERSDLIEPSTRVYQSVDRRLVNLLRAINEMPGLIDRHKAEIVKEVRDGFSETLENVDPGDSLINDELWTELAKRYRAQNDELAQNLISGPSTKFRFPLEREPSRVAEQAFTMEEARVIAKLRWGEEIEATSTAVRPRKYDIVPRRPRADVFVGLTAMIRAPLEQLLNWVYFHLNSGYHQIALFVDGPPFYSELNNIRQLSVVNCDSEFWSSMSLVAPTNLQKLHFARELGHETLVAAGADWVVAIDGDELLCGDLAQELVGTPSDVSLLRIPVAEAVHHDGMTGIAGFPSRVFKVLSGPSREDRKTTFELYQSVSEYTRQGYFGHTEGKTAARAGVDADMWGCHSVLNTKDRLLEVTSKSCLLLHFESPPFDEWLARWRHKIDTVTTATELSHARMNQFRRIETLLNDRDQSGALLQQYESWYFMDGERIRELHELDRIIRLEIDEEMFGPSESL